MSDEDYEVLRISISWGLLSILVFLIVITLQIYGWRTLGINIAQLALSTLGLSVLGLALGLIGLKFGRGRRAAKVGTFLNGVVLFCVFVLLPVSFYVSRLLR
ncbi:MAG: hypothetical protein GY719_01300 [bacterium]|nr:hypothetical protein [bacterium]